MEIGIPKIRVDAADKVTGAAKYTGDLEPRDCLVARVVHSTIANGRVVSIDVSEAEKVPGVVRILTCFDVPDIQFPTPGHPWSVEAAHQDVSDRKLLNQRVRVYGDDIAAVVAVDDVAAARAVRAVRVEYEEYPACVTVDDALNSSAPPIHEEKPDNVLVRSALSVGDMTFDEAAASEPDLLRLEKTYETQTVQHCHIEPPVSHAYMAGGKITVVTSTQIPHIVRRVIGQALGIPWGDVRVVKPYIGGGFGNKQDVLYEPLNAWLCQQVGGRCVKLEISREETLANTRVRHAIRFQVEAAVRPDGAVVARRLRADSNQGGYASHGHAIVANAANCFKQLYRDRKALEAQCRTVYTNIAAGGAMRGYGIPQADFAAECMADDLAALVGMDPLEFRYLNCMGPDYEDPHTHVKFNSYGLKACMEKGAGFIGWKELREKYRGQTGPVRRGVGMAIFCYKTGVHPISLETASCRMLLNQDGSVQLQMGATEIGQGADTVFIQMAAECTGIPAGRIHIVSAQDTDTAPFDTGAYASRQTYVSGKAVKKTGAVFKRRILDYAAGMLSRPAEALDLRGGEIVDASSGAALLPLGEVAVTAFYSLDKSVHISAEETSHCKENTFASGVCFCEVEVDIPMGKVKVLNIVNVHDSGVLINPKLAEAQVHGGMSMGLGYALGEELIYDGKARPLNPNLLDYKLPTVMDTPKLNALFVEVPDPTGPFGNKALGEPPAIPVAPAVRNAVLHATGVAVDSLPLTPQKLVERFTQAGLI
ncbi:xanthine dehydrogenase molybdenum-binding subunit XdhA [Pseudoflavonifractor sp. BIOML-A6]|nr:MULTISPECIES: xanthine dehydrogenase subunit XdhA [unclassified Pseudoflavonifractor]MTR05091.1 xanthine dehydrogenase molybdenum-binding subunit XdhA [Pseudoflavonifractor sp. BIOML-A15]MTR32712.1 xanthine dehydrogenase molybdenum-binding subunit XdhA [Pseudoflavonifractor sp. BIOML-A14]MTR72106.1 xanthine dehydrogenase molybdenum-binding subunit XdhA [Pseudoflavonifractor sp. BIOML-A18]MTS65068.1 xanthine dehydrogenase molybdenum-binding subunit XdhA [Pseudoflavonifractor sp. BIOML-A5]MTR